MQSRQEETDKAKKLFLQKKHWNYNALLKYIHEPNFGRNILDPKNNLIKKDEE